MAERTPRQKTPLASPSPPPKTSPKPTISKNLLFRKALTSLAAPAPSVPAIPTTVPVVLALPTTESSILANPTTSSAIPALPATAKSAIPVIPVTESGVLVASSAPAPAPTVAEVLEMVEKFVFLGKSLFELEVIYVETIQQCNAIAKLLEESGWKGVVSILPSSEQDQIMLKLRGGEIRYICQDSEVDDPCYIPSRRVHPSSDEELLNAPRTQDTSASAAPRTQDTSASASASNPGNINVEQSREWPRDPG